MSSFEFTNKNPEIYDDRRVKNVNTENNQPAATTFATSAAKSFSSRSMPSPNWKRA
jgi:hypothetical protein